MKPYLTYAGLAVLDLLFTLFACGLVNWWAAWLADEDGWLPDWLAWCQTFDAPLDQGWQSGMSGYRAPSGPLSRWWQRTQWLYRNPAYGFGYWPMGTSFDAKQWTVTRFERTPARELFVAQGPDGTFSVLYYGGWGTLKLGWKAWNYYDQAGAAIPGHQWGPAMRAPLCASYTPFKRKVPPKV